MYIKHQLIKENKIETRAYQENLAKSALEKGNTLVVAPTALGKTIIAALVAVNVLDKGKVLFLAPTKPLANQHLKSFEELLTINTLSLFTGETKDKERKTLWHNSQIIFATPQTIKNCISKNRINLNEVSLLIVDEAHRAVGDYAYVYIAQKYAKIQGSHILALTASPGSTKEKIKEVCDNLAIQHVEMRTEEDTDVQPYVHEKSIDWIRLDLP
ncbi:DEAD/DEAH box helicase, partial [archaeon]|nr:DEAD/DEAH box helicase [archaeon]